MDSTAIIALLATILAILVFGGGGWLVFRWGYRNGYGEASGEAVPMAGTCGNCGKEFLAGSVAEAMTMITEHDCPALREA